MRFKKINSKVEAVIAIILIIFICSLIYPNVQAQTKTSFTPADKFSIPSSNATVSFAYIGNYSTATFESNNWLFQNLSMNRSTPLQNFLISAQNSNITIFTYVSFNLTQTLRLSYQVVGNGKQVFNFGQSRGNGIDWTVTHTVNGKTAFLTEGVDWTISSNGTVVINYDATGNFSVIRYSFANGISDSSNLPFYEQHSVAIATLAAVAIVVVLAAALAVRNNRILREKNVHNTNRKGSILKDKEKP